MAPVAPNACMMSLATMPGTTRWRNAMKKMAAGIPHIAQRPRAAVSAKESAGPETGGIAVADDGQLLGARRGRRADGRGHGQRPARRDIHAFDALPGMKGSQVHLPRVRVEAVDAERRDHGRRSAARQADALAPARALAEAGRGDEVDALAEAVALLRHDHDESPREA